MTFPISDQVQLALTIASGGLRALELSTPMLIGYHTAWVAERVRSYTSLAGMVADGITAGTPLYRMATALFAQTPSPSSVRIGRRANAPVHAVELTPQTFALGSTITCTIVAPDGSSRSYSSPCDGVSLADEATDLAGLMNADVSGYGAAGTTELLIAAVGNDVTIDPGAGAATGQIFWYTELRNLDLKDVTPDPGLAADITAIQAEDDDWYAAALDSTSEDEQNALALALSTGNKSVWIASQDADVRDAVAGNLFEDLFGAGYSRAIPIWSAHGMHEYPACAAMAKLITFRPGATTLANQSLTGVTRSGLNAWDLSAAQLGNIRGLRGNAYIDFGGVGQIDPQAGYCSADRYVDERLTLDYIEANVPVELANSIRALTNVGKKVPYTDEAATVARSAILRILSPMESDQWGALLLRDKATGEQYFTFSATPAASQTAADKAARIFRGCDFACKITGAAQQFILSGTLSFV